MKHVYYFFTILTLFDIALGEPLPRITNAPVKRDDSSNVVIEGALADFTKTTVGFTEANTIIDYIVDMRTRPR